MEQIYNNLVQDLKSFFKKQGFSKGVVGVSGGIDSALTLKLSVDALGKENVLGLILPEEGLTSDENIKDATEFCKELGVAHFYRPINSYIESFEELPWEQNSVAVMNLKARVRMVLLYHFANSNQTLVLGTSNKSEIMLGYGTKYGDFAADVEVIGNLYKGQVYELAQFLDLPTSFIEKKPSAELAKGQTDESEMGISYEQADKVLKLIDKGKGKEEVLAAIEDKELVEKVFKLNKSSKHKTELPYIINI